jgi:hypothetical protein
MNMNLKRRQYRELSEDEKIQYHLELKAKASPKVTIKNFDLVKVEIFYCDRLISLKEAIQKQAVYPIHIGDTGNQITLAVMSSRVEVIVEPAAQDASSKEDPQPSTTNINSNNTMYIDPFCRTL